MSNPLFSHEVIFFAFPPPFRRLGTGLPPIPVFPTHYDSSAVGEYIDYLLLCVFGTCITLPSIIMSSMTAFIPALLVALAAAAPAPQVPGYTGATTLTASSAASGQTLATSFGPDSQISAIVPTPGFQPPQVSSQETGTTSHGPYSGTPTIIGAANGPTTLAASVGTLPPNPTATYYNSAGVPLNPFPAPYTPAGTLFSFGTEKCVLILS